MKEKLFICSELDRVIFGKVYDRKYPLYSELKTMIKTHSYNNAGILYENIIWVFYGNNHHSLCNKDKIIVAR